jgi:hypothetical protein
MAKPNQTTKILELKKKNNGRWPLTNLMINEKSAAECARVAATRSG